MKKYYRFFSILIILLLISSLTACGKTSSKSIGVISNSNSITLKVGSKDFTEQLILGQITMQVLQNAGYTVVDKTNVSGSDVCRSALLSGEFNIYWEYTGTGWQTHLGKTELISDPAKLYDELSTADAANGITWLAYAPLNNTYALAMKKAKADELGISTYSGLAKYIQDNPQKLVMACDHEFTVRPDCLPGLEETYQVKLSDDISVMDMGIIYSTLESGQADVGMVFATDGRIPRYNLILLEDDKNFFPIYNAAPCLRTETLTANPDIADLLNPISKLLTNEVMQDLNYQVDGEGMEPDEVAQKWLTDNGFLE